jgi:hypothetical protein
MGQMSSGKSNRNNLNVEIDLHVLAIIILLFPTVEVLSHFFRMCWTGLAFAVVPQGMILSRVYQDRAHRRLGYFLANEMIVVSVVSAHFGYWLHLL